MKPEKANRSKLNLDKQTIQRLDSQKLASVNAGEISSHALLSAISVTVSGVACTSYCIATMAGD